MHDDDPPRFQPGDRVLFKGCPRVLRVDWTNSYGQVCCVWIDDDGAPQEMTVSAVNLECAEEDST